MKLDTLLSGLDIKTILGSTERSVIGIACDSRQVKQGDVFVAVRGFQSDGHNYLAQAAEKGAVALVIDTDHELSDEEQSYYQERYKGITVVAVDNSRRSLALVADTFYGGPSRRLKLVGVTGTNGKTTTTYLLKSVLESFGERVGLLGTINYQICGEILPAPNTTPDSLELTRYLARMVEKRASYGVMEVSSHALALNRVDGCRFDAAIFTNLTQDHLDFHKNMEDYFQSKLSLFTRLDERAIAIINADDPYSGRILKNSGAPVMTYGLTRDADVSAVDVTMNAAGLSFTAMTSKGGVKVTSPLTGRHNLYNILAALAFAVSQGVPVDTAARGFATMRQVPGRFERVEKTGDITVIVDYAHTSDALERALEAVRVIVPQGARLFVLFGCGGDRDPGKRPLMGEVAGRLADRIFVTSDNPRSEKPADIIEQILPGVRGAFTASGRDQSACIIIEDRHDAIIAAVGEMEKGDVLLVAGKGHEDYQILGDRKIHFDDREVAAEAVRIRTRLKGNG
ncbi:MAG: UDP-N-acetylmuramoyl-L-alanyl-D-glutamate--2,6-diaminopimelate ligase [Nitrospirota bacterium]|nr:UDP-N-acetylmuramoyl-L-alanyl-D-glutamate--2,6-diaminopimelate ligase [Nitrospirota bacterium]